MIYAVCIDWLALYCHYTPVPPSPNDCHDVQKAMDAYWEPAAEEDADDIFGRYPFRYKLQQYGTRQFAKLYKVSMPNAEGGWDDFAEIQAHPHAGVLYKHSIIVRFVNRVLYLPDFWELAQRLLSDNDFAFRNISRIDICADFNQFATIPPLTLIEDFAAKKLRHIGRGVGAIFFNHEVRRGEYGVHPTGLTFGTHASDAHVYLYNKSFELLTKKDKPYIRDLWNSIGLDMRNVWRLEVSIKSKGVTFKDRTSGNEVTIGTGVLDKNDAEQYAELTKIYHTFVRKLFSFIKNRPNISNVTREPRIQLFDGAPAYDRSVPRNISSSTRIDKMVIKSLYQLGDLYRGAANIDAADLAQSFAIGIAESTDLGGWMSNKIKEWERPTHK